MAGSESHPIGSRALRVRQRRLQRRVATDFFVDVDVDTSRYSVPHRFVRRTVDVLVGEVDVAIFDGHVEITRHRRGSEPHQRIANPRHFDGLYRQRDEAVAPSSLTLSLDVYADAIGGGA